MAKKQKYYVVWNGFEDGVFTSWEECKQSVLGYSGARYKSYNTEAEAQAAWENGEPFTEEKGDSSAQGAGSIAQAAENISDGKAATTRNDTKSPKDSTNINAPQSPNQTAAKNDWNAIAVDAACSGNPGRMEYRGVYLRTGKEIFHSPVMYGTNNIGEFLAIVHGLALLKQKGLDTMPIYSDSVNAQLWIRKRKCRTSLERNEKTEALFKIIDRAEAWLRNNTYANPIVKWRTDEWGEIPADFGRK